MAAPKPWESTIPMSSQPLSASMQPMNNGIGPAIDQPRTQGPAPPLPPRMIQQQQQQQQQQQLGFYGASNYVNPYAFNPYQAGGLYNNYRMSPFGMQSNVPVGNFSQLAMDESRSAFSSIESVIHAFRSISVMFESTFASVYSSFRAVTDVFDQFTRIRTELAAVYPLVLLWRFLKYLYHRLLRILHIRPATYGTAEETWSAIYQGLQQTRMNANGSATSSSSSNLLVALFFLVSFGTPMLMLKVLNSIIKKRQAASNWLNPDTNQARVAALYDYTARNADELSFTKGQTIYLAPLHLQSSNSHWFLGSVDQVHSGLFPANYVQPMRQTTSSSIDLRPQMPFNSTEAATTVASSPLPPPPVSSSTITNIPPSIFNSEEQPTLT